MINDKLTSEDEYVLSLHYQGLSREEISQKTGISTGKISGITADEKKRLGEGNVDAIRRAGVEMHKAGESWPTLADAIAILNHCNKYNIDQEDLKDNLPGIVNKLKEHGRGLSYLPNYIEEREELDAGIEAKRNALQKEIKQLEDKLIQKREEAGHTDISLAKCRELSDFLAKQGLSPNSPEKLKNALLNAEAAAGYNGEVLVEKIAATSSLEADRNKLEQEIKELTRQKEQYDTKIKEQELQIMRNSDTLNEAAELNRMGCNTAMLKAIKEKVKEIAATPSANGTIMMTTDKQATEKFTTDVLTKYEPLAGFEQAIYTKKKEEADLKARIEKFKIQHAKDSRVIEALEILHENGVSNTDILAMKHLAESEGWSLIALDANVTLYGSLDKARVELEGKVKDLDTKKGILNLDVSDLSNRKTALEAFLQDADDRFKKGIGSLIANVDDVSKQIRETTNGAIKDISDAKEGVVRNVKDIGEAANKAVKQFAETQAVSVFAPLIRAVKGERVDSNELRDVVMFAIDILLSHMPSTSTSRHALEIAKKNLNDDASFIFSL